MSFLHALALTVVAVGGLGTCTAVVIDRSRALWHELERRAEEQAA